MSERYDQELSYDWCWRCLGWAKAKVGFSLILAFDSVGVGLYDVIYFLKGVTKSFVMSGVRGSLVISTAERCSLIAGGRSESNGEISSDLDHHQNGLPKSNCSVPLIVVGDLR